MIYKILMMQKYFTFGTQGDVLFYATTSKVYSYVFNGAVTELLSTSGGDCFHEIVHAFSQ